MEAQLSSLEKIYQEFKLHSNKKQSDEEVIIEKAVKSTLQKLYDKGLFDNYDKADEI